jgi:hypothetical protein
MAATLESSNVEGARAALRSLIGTISVFEKAGKLYGRIGVNPMPLYRRNPSTFGVMVAGAGFATSLLPGSPPGSSSLAEVAAYWISRSRRKRSLRCRKTYRFFRTLNRTFRDRIFSLYKA